MKLKTTIYGKSSTLIGTPEEVAEFLEVVRKKAIRRAVDALPKPTSTAVHQTGFGGNVPTPKLTGHSLAEQIRTAAKTIQTPKSPFKPTFEPIAQTREEIVKEAIADVADLLGRNFSSRECSVPLGVWFVSDYGRFKVTDELLFNVNKKKRTIHATIRNKTYPRNKHATGIARCAPSDVFNEHVGKAIALRRALGLEVPTKYYEVGGIAPEGKQVGDVVRGYSTMLGADEDCVLAEYPIISKNEVGVRSFFAGHAKVIDDSARYVAPSTPAAKVVYVD